jgi:hypothetical protein
MRIIRPKLPPEEKARRARRARRVSEQGKAASRLAAQEKRRRAAMAADRRDARLALEEMRIVARQLLISSTHAIAKARRSRIRTSVLNEPAPR